MLDFKHRISPVNNAGALVDEFPRWSVTAIKLREKALIFIILD